MNKKLGIIIGVLVVLLVATGVLVYNALFGQSANTTPAEEQKQEELATIDPSVKVDVVKSKGKESTVVLTVSGLASKYETLEYELTYDTLGIIQGVNNGKDPIAVTNKDSFEREVYLGTCSGTKCTPHKGVEKISLVLQLADGDGRKSQLVKDFEL